MNLHFENSKEIPEITGEVHKIAHGPGEPGIRPGIHITNGNLILDFGQPIQYLGLTQQEAHAMVAALLVSTFEANDQPKQTAN